MASGWNLWMWLECIVGVVSGWCKEVYNYIDILIIIITFPYSTCISSFLAAASPLYSFKKCFFVFVYVIFLQYSKRVNVAQRTLVIVQNSRSREHSDINYIDMNVEHTSTARARASPEISTCEVRCDVSRKLQLTLCAIMAS